jgi:N-acyl-D-amino-acid deacylase
MSLLIRGSRLVDGSGAPSFEGEILIEGDRIAAMGPRVDRPEGARIVDASGLVACPGFIDMHGHNDLRVMDDPSLLPKLMQGITTEVIGQDGISMAPLPPERVEAWRQYLAEFDGKSERMDWNYADTRGYLAALSALRPAANYCYMVPHGNLRLATVGLGNEPLSVGDIDRMASLLRHELEAGGFGLSTGLIYAPCSYAGPEELVALCRVVSKYDGVFMIHQRSEADAILESMEEVLGIGRKSSVRVHFSHFKVCGRKNAGKLDKMLAMMDAAEAEGIELSFDQYPYMAGSTSLGMILPPWAHSGGVDRLFARLARPEDRRRMRRDIESGLPGWDDFIDFAGFEGIFLTSASAARNRPFIGKSLARIAEAQGKTPFDAAFDLILEERNEAGMVDFYGTEEAVARIMRREEMSVCTDGILDERPHPRVYGAFPRILGKYVREEGLLSLEAAVRKMTGKSASVLRLSERGLLRPGYYADVVLFDPETVRDVSTFDDPTRFPLGIEYVIVNGEMTVERGVYAGGRAGRVLRRNRAESPASAVRGEGRR